MNIFRRGALSAAFAGMALLAACATPQPPVIDKLDEVTGVTITHSRMPFTLSSDAFTQPAVDYVQLGAIEINKMGSMSYYLWLGISEPDFAQPGKGLQSKFEAVDIVLDGNATRIELHGQTHASIGTLEPVYKKLFRSTAEAYYEVDLDLISRMVQAEDMALRTVEAEPKEYTLWYQSTTAEEDLAEFLNVVSQ